MKSKKVGAEVLGSLNDKVVAKSIKNRRRIGAECYRLRECIEETILEKFEDPYVLVMGDLNTGPGSGFFERYYLLFDSCDVLLGSPFERNKKLYAPMINGNFIDREDLWSAVFKDFLDGRVKRVLVDHIFVNRSLKNKVRWTGIAHDIFQKNQKPSDHVPVYMDLF